MRDFRCDAPEGAYSIRESVEDETTIPLNYALDE